MPLTAKSASDATSQSTAKAAAYAIGVALLLPLVDTLVKWLVQDYAIAMVAWVRMGLISIFLGVTGASSVGMAILRPVAWRLQIARGLAAVLGTTMVFIGFQVLPLAECLAIVFIAPVIANIFSQIYLKERGSLVSWALALVSFFGVLLIAKPGTDLFTFNAVYPLVGAFGLAAFLTLTRAVAEYDKSQVTAFFGPFIAFLAFSLVLPVYWVTPKSTTDIAMFLAIGVLASAATLLQTLSYRYGTTHVVAPFGYSSLIVAIGLGWAVFGSVPDQLSVLGMVVIAAAGIAMVFATRKPN
ncbi:MAG: DMT family transporter [Burkholderiaceae bacterium]